MFWMEKSRVDSILNSGYNWVLKFSGRELTVTWFDHVIVVKSFKTWAHLVLKSEFDFAAKQNANALLYMNCNHVIIDNTSAIIVLHFCMGVTLDQTFRHFPHSEGFDGKPKSNWREECLNQSHICFLVCESAADGRVPNIFREWIPILEESRWVWIKFILHFKLIVTKPK